MNHDQKVNAAFRLCDLRGIDPYEVVIHAAEPEEIGEVHAALYYTPAWKLSYSEIERRLIMDEAIKAGIES